MNDLRSILDKKRNAGYYLKSAWYFEKFYEKFIMIGLNLLGFWKLIELIIRVLK